MDNAVTDNTYILSYSILAKRVDELYFTKAAAIERMCQLGCGCVQVVSQPVAD